MQMGDLQPRIPSPAKKEDSSHATPHLGTPAGIMPYGGSGAVNPFASSSFHSMRSNTPIIYEDTSPWENVDLEVDQRPVSPISPKDNGRRSWFKESLFDVGGRGSSSPVSPTAAQATDSSPVTLQYTPVTPAAATLAPPVALSRSRTLSRAGKFLIPDVLRPGFRRNLTDDPVLPVTQNAASAVHDSGGRHRGDASDNPLRMNSVKPSMSRRFSQA